MDPEDRTIVSKQRLFDFFMYEDGYVLYKKLLIESKKKDANALRSFVNQIGLMKDEEKKEEEDD